MPVIGKRTACVQCDDGRYEQPDWSENGPGQARRTGQKRKQRYRDAEKRDRPPRMNQSRHFN
jgi:hypothetical protein